MRKKLIKVLNKKFEKPITCLTSYSPSIAKILDGNVDIILIGDSLGSTLYGMKNSQGVTLGMMKIHGRVVTNNINKSLTMIDMPYLTYTNKKQALRNSRELLKYTNAHLLKLEINSKNINIVNFLSKKNYKIFAHIGVTPQSFQDFKKIKVVGKNNGERKDLVNLAISLEEAGAVGILLECVTEKTAKEITEKVSIPTIGIGSSKFCDGQVLVFDDLICIDDNQHSPKFVKKYMNFALEAKKVTKKFNKDVKEGKFPSKKYTYF